MLKVCTVVTVFNNERVTEGTGRKEGWKDYFKIEFGRLYQGKLSALSV